MVMFVVIVMQCSLVQMMGGGSIKPIKPAMAMDLYLSSIFTIMDCISMAYGKGRGFSSVSFCLCLSVRFLIRL